MNQTYAAIHARLQTSESQGDLISSQIVEEGGRYKFTGVYRNEGRLEVRDRSPIHNGAFILDIEGDTLNPSSLSPRSAAQADPEPSSVSGREGGHIATSSLYPT